MSHYIAQEEEKLNIQRLAVEKRLGNLEATYAAKAGSIAWAVYGLLAFAFALLGIWGVLSGVHAGDPIWLRMVALLLFILFAGGILLFVYSTFSHRFDKTLLYEYGLIRKTSKGLQVVRWEQILYIRTNTIYTQYATDVTHEVHLKKGETIKFSDGNIIRHIERLMKASNNG